MSGASEPLPAPELLAGCRASHARLLERLDDLDDDAARRPSRLPGWSVGHVLTHVSRNADSFVRMLGGAAEGRSVVQYDGGEEGRASEIELGADRPAAQLLEDVHASSARLEDAFARAAPEVWARSGKSLSGEDAPLSRLPMRRLREVEIHHVDLGLGYEVTDWPDLLVDATLGEVLFSLPKRISDPRQRAALLAWAVGRSDSPGRIELDPF